jgi:hypothetical protein
MSYPTRTVRPAQSPSGEDHAVTDNKPTDLRAQLGDLAGADPDTEPAEVAADILRRARWALAHNDGHPNGAWSTGEQLGVALALNDTEYLAAMGYTTQEAAERVAGGMYFPPADFDAWLAGIRAQLTN